MIIISRKRLVTNYIFPLVNALVMGLLLFQGAFASSGRDNTQWFITSQIETAGKPIQPDSIGRENNLRVLEAEDRSLTLELVTPEFSIESGTAEGNACQVIHIQDYGETDIPGYPRLPMRGELIGVPEGPDLSLVIIDAQPVQIDGRFDLCPVESLIVEQDPSGEIRYLGNQAIRDQTAYSMDQYWPSPVVELISTGYIRSQRTAQVSFHPFQFNPVTGELLYYSRIRVRVNLPSMKTSAAPYNLPDEGEFESILSDNLVNYSTARVWRSEMTSPRSLQLDSLSLGENTYKLLVDQDGIYRVSYADLVSAGVNITGVDPSTFQLFNQGSEVAISVLGENDGSFDPGDSILFYGQKVDSKYTGENVYFLTSGLAMGRRMETSNGSPGGADIPSNFLNSIHREQNVNYLSNFPSGSNSDVWYWDYVYASTAPASKTFQATLNNISTSPSETARLRVLLKGHSATPQHHTRVYINDHLVDDATWSVLEQHFIEVEIPQTYLLEGVNTLKVECPRDGGITKDIVLVNWLEIDYWDNYTVENDRLDFSGNTTGSLEYHLAGFTTPEIEVFDITDSSSPILISNALVQSNLGKYDLVFEQTIASEHRYIAFTSSGYLTPTDIVKDEATDLHSTANRADYIIITHKDFYDQIIPLANWRTASGLHTMIVKVDDIYDEFNHGLVNPSAIHDFLAYAYTNWQSPAPQYVLLVGDGNYDPRNYLGTAEKNYIPAYLEQVDTYIGETASDNQYVTVSGSDNLPDMFIGRLPVKTSAETAIVVAKILAYEADMTPEIWSDDVLFVADNTDSGGNFPYYSDLIVNNFLPTGYTPQKIYYGNTHTVVSEAKTAILDAINQGRLMVNYVGHGSIQSWASESLLSLSSLSSLNNGSNLPFVAALSCLTGSFHYPSLPGTDNSSISEKLLLTEGKGSIASWGSSGMGLASGQDYLNRGLYQAMFYEGENALGVATTQAKIYLKTYMNSQSSLNDIYTLFGDPAMRLKVMRADVEVNLVAQPATPIHSGDVITYTLNFSNQGDTLATHVSIDTQLPSWLVDPTFSSSGASVTMKPDSQYSWDVENLAPGNGGSITVKGVMEVPATSEVETQASITTSIADANQSNNSSEIMQTVILNPLSAIIYNLKATPGPGFIQIYWQVMYPFDDLYFNVYRSNTQNGERTRLTDNPIPSLQQSRKPEDGYFLQDTSLLPGTIYYYWIESVDSYRSIFYSFDPVISPYAMYLPTVVR
jgi:uncharacterized repeat protein (TIGR01451 family)